MGKESPGWNLTKREELYAAAMVMWAKMFQCHETDVWKKIDGLSGMFLPLVMPWVLVPSGIFIFSAFVQACAENSPHNLFVYVVIPVALWMGFSRSCGPRVYRPVFAPSSVGTLITIMIATHSLHVSSATGGLYNAIFGATCILLGAMFLRMIWSNPGRVLPLPNSYTFLSNQTHLDIGNIDSCRDPDNFSTVMEVDDERMCSTCNVNQPLRSKHCKHCNVCIERFDHHCPAIGNCVGRKNHLQFLTLLLAFIFTELIYVNSCIIYLQDRHALETWPASEPQYQEGNFFNDVELIWGEFSKVLRKDPWVFSTATIAGIQALWQVPLLIFHIYCACCNLTTDEMFHWEKYPGMYTETRPAPARGRPFVGKDFLNPYTKGIKQNLISFCGVET